MGFWLLSHIEVEKDVGSKNPPTHHRDAALVGFFPACARSLHEAPVSVCLGLSGLCGFEHLSSHVT